MVERERRISISLGGGDASHREVQLTVGRILRQQLLEMALRLLQPAEIDQHERQGELVTRVDRFDRERSPVLRQGRTFVSVMVELLSELEMVLSAALPLGAIRARQK